MKKNMMFIGMLVALLIVPNYTFAQTVVADSAATAAADSLVAVAAPVADSAVAVADTIAPVVAAEAAAVETAVVAEEKKVREPRVQKVDSTHYSYGSVINVHIGFGASGLWATEGNAQLKNSWGFPGFNVGLRYSYYFLSWLGFTTGLDYSTYRSSISMAGVMDWKSGVDTKLGEEYIHRLNFSGEGKAQSTWTEIEDLGMIEIPIALSFKYKPNKVGLISTVGLKLGFPVKGRYSYEGNLNHSGYVSSLNYLEYGDNRFIANDSYDETFKEYKKGTWSAVNGEVFGEIGALFQVHERVDLSLSVYGSYGFNDINKTAYNDRQELGFHTDKQSSRVADKDMDGYSYMNAYNGLIGTKAIDHINPWNLGVKIGVHIYCADENDAERARRLAAMNVAPAPQIIYIRDTVREEIRDTVKVTEVVRDTVQTQVVVHDTIVNQIEKVTRMLEKVIIYYKSGDSKTPIINPSNLLDDAAAIIAANPAIRVSVEGHASSDGNPQYNQMLSENRALNVAKILRDKGVQDSQIEIQAYGSSHPLKFGNQDDPNKDRRVEIIPIQAQY